MQGKKTFLLYADMIHIFDELTDDQAGKLIKHIFKYVNDLEPVFEEQLLKIAFAPIKNALKKDLEEWLKICERNKTNGIKGGRPKKPKEPTGFSGNPNNPVKPDKDKDKDKDIINKGKKSFFIVDANSDLVEYRTYFFQLIKQKQVSRDVLLKNSRIDLSRRNELWEAFILNAISETPQIEDEKHAWNCFKKFVKDNAREYQVKESMLNHNWE